MRQIELTGRHAIGQHRFAIVDDDIFDELNAYRWKAKPNGNVTGVYAVRNVWRDGGGTRTIRMHRVILGYDGALDVDHINHCTLDNRRDNLRAVTRSVNIANGTPLVASGICPECKKDFIRPTITSAAHRVRYCSKTCSIRTKERRRTPRRRAIPIVRHLSCAQCSSLFQARRSNNVYCSSRCKSRAKWLLKCSRAAGLLGSTGPSPTLGHNG